MSDRAPLHPDRIREALRSLKQALDCEDTGEWSPTTFRTCVAALEAVRKCQLAMGLTSEVVERGTLLLNLMRALEGE